MRIETVLFIISLLICGIILYVLGKLWFVDTRNRKLRSLFLLGITVLMWTLLNSILIITGPQSFSFIFTLRMMTVCIIPCSVLWFFLNFTASKLTQSKAVISLLILLPVLDILALITNPFHLLYFSKYNNSRAFSGPLFWVHTAVSYAIVLLAFIVLIRHIIQYAKERPALVWAAGGTLLPYALNILYTLDAPGFTYDLTPYGFFVAFMVLAWLSYRARLLSVKTNAFADIFAALDNIILIADMDHTVVDFNQALCAYFPDFTAEAGKTRIKDFLNYLSLRMKSCSADGLLDSISHIQGAKRFEGELEISTPGSSKTFTINRRVIHTGWRINGYVLVLSDISEYRAMIAEIDEQNKRLTELKDIAESASSAKGDFLSRMSHEIRTPLNAIIGMVGIAMGSDDISRIKDCLCKADNASKHLLGVINDILDMSKIEADKFELDYHEFNFEKMLMNVTNVTNFRAEEKKQNFIVNLNGNVPESIFGDDLRLAQVITNLLTNAVKFTPECGTVVLNIDKIEDNGSEVTLKIEVEDNGIGISPEQQERLFTSFEQADGGIARKFGGTGLGLAISKRIVELMGGKIWIESEIGKGSKFIFTVKAGKSKATARAKLSPKINRDDMRILAVDDSPEIRDYFTHVMESLELPCDVAGNGGEALGMIKNCGNRPYNIFFIDWQMPEMNGIELTGKIKETAPDNSVVFMISAAEWSVIEKEALTVGVRSFISKPLFPSTLVNAINECLEIETQNPNIGADGLRDKHQRNFNGHTILIAEDVEINREIMSAVLEDTGIHIDFAENGSTAVSMFEDNPGKYSLVLMDIHMPEMDGYEATRRIRTLELPQVENIPIIAMTANVFREDIENCLAAGMNDHLGKPVDTDELFAKIEQYLPNI